MDITPVEEDQVSAWQKSNSVHCSHSKSKSLIIRLLDGMFEMLKEANSFWRHFAQFFLIPRDFAALGADERRYFIKINAITKLIDFYWGEQSPNFPKMRNNFNHSNPTSHQHSHRG